jgi:hypothetical protein
MLRIFFRRHASTRSYEGISDEQNEKASPIHALRSSSVSAIAEVDSTTSAKAVMIFIVPSVKCQPLR